MIEWLSDQPYGHRGFHDKEAGLIENSLSAFHAAIEQGYGIELDVQLSGDDDAVVFHDRTLDKLTGETGPVSARSTEELREITLTGSQDTIPTLDHVLSVIDGQVPVLVEVKTKPREAPGALEQAVLGALESYDGPFAVMSFAPDCVAWFQTMAPWMPRGLVAMDFVAHPVDLSFAERLALARLHFVRQLDPDFVAYDCRSIPNKALRTVRQRGIQTLSWTVRDQDMADHVDPHVDQIIFEGFIPAA